jgi:hypothetical protein
VISGNNNATGGAQFTGCSTDRNNYNGMYIDAAHGPGAIAFAADTA